MEITITHRQGQQLLQYLSSGIRFPEKLGKEEYDVAQRSFADEEIVLARKLLLSYSQLWAKKRKLLFGNADNWKGKDDAKESWQQIDPEVPITLKSSDEAVERGLYWILLLMLHPGSPAQGTIETIDDTIYPIAEQLGYRNDLREATGLGQRKLPRLPKKDSDPSWKKDEKKVDLEPAAK
jgi:hypothetical protein